MNNVYQLRKQLTVTSSFGWGDFLANKEFLSIKKTVIPK